VRSSSSSGSVYYVFALEIVEREKEREKERVENFNIIDELRSIWGECAGWRSNM
jgi:hypothetical protein